MHFSKFRFPSAIKNKPGLDPLSIITHAMSPWQCRLYRQDQMLTRQHQDNGYPGAIPTQPCWQHPIACIPLFTGFIL
jgi:hypothetical protein